MTRASFCLTALLLVTGFLPCGAAPDPFQSQRPLAEADAAASSVGGSSANPAAGRASVLRGDTGILRDIAPSGAAWVGDDMVMVSDARANVFHVFDLNGRRYQYSSHPRKLGGTHFNALCAAGDGVYFTSGSHWHDKNNTRFLENRSVMHRLTWGEDGLGADSGRENLSPDTALRATGLYGESTPEHGEITGMAMDAASNRVFFSMDRCLDPQGNLIVLEGKLDQFLAHSPEFALQTLKTGLRPGLDATTGQPYELTDLAYVPDQGLVLLLASENSAGDSFGSNQLWFMPGAQGPAEEVARDLAPGNHATGLAARMDGGRLKSVLVCDNHSAPSRLVVLDSLTLPSNK